MIKYSAIYWWNEIKTNEYSKGEKVNIHTYTHTHIYTYTYTCAHTYTHIYIYIYLKERKSEISTKIQYNGIQYIHT